MNNLTALMTELAGLRAELRKAEDVREIERILKRINEIAAILINAGIANP